MWTVPLATIEQSSQTPQLVANLEVEYATDSEPPPSFPPGASMDLCGGVFTNTLGGDELIYDEHLPALAGALTPTHLTTTVFDVTHNMNWDNDPTEVTGTQARDQASMSYAGAATATGSVDYALYDGSSCIGPVVTSSAGQIVGDGEVEDSTTTPPPGRRQRQLHGQLRR